MNSWILTGGVATGKSSVWRTLGNLEIVGLQRFSCDDAAAAALQSAGVIAQLSEAFGPCGWDGGAVDRAWIRANVLPVPEKRARLEAIVHPIVFAELEAARVAAERGGANLFVAEVPLHYETGASVSADLIIVVAASLSVQVRRMMENRGLDEQSVHSFLDAQWPIEAKAERADVVIWNDGDISALEAQVSQLSTYLRQS
ncbi:MAG: dephospho-CoA kinase [Verrucomicrobiales bacterium]